MMKASELVSKALSIAKTVKRCMSWGALVPP